MATKRAVFDPIKLVLTMPLCIAGITSGTWAVMYICIKGIDLASVSRIIRIDFRTVLTVLYFLFVNILIYVKMYHYKQNYNEPKQINL
jgi:energy-coupling factor transporter transmembrane protein EcfT